MSNFNPLDFDYELISNEEGIAHYHKRLYANKPLVIYELAHYRTENIWLIFIESTNLNQYLPKDKHIAETYKINLYAGKIKNNYDFRFLMNKIVKRPDMIAKLGNG